MSRIPIFETGSISDDGYGRNQTELHSRTQAPCKLPLLIDPIDLVDSFGHFLKCVLDPGWFIPIAGAQWSASSAGVRLRLRLRPSLDALQPKDRQLFAVRASGRR